MYIERVPNRKSAPAILLRESYRENGKVRKRTLANLTHWSPEVVKQFENLLKGGRTIECLDKAFDIVRSLPHGHVAAVVGTIKRTQLDKVLAQRATLNRQLVLAMVASRILDPASKLATARQLSPQTHSHTLSQQLGLASVTKDSLYRAMDWLQSRQERIEQHLGAAHLKEGSVVLFDISSTYLEGEHCPLAKRGYNRDKKKGMVQVVFGLVCNAQGCPVAVEVFEGNTSDPSTLKTQLTKLKERFKLSRGILVGDRGMLPNTKIQSELKTTQGWEWITALKSAQIRKLLEANAFELEKLQTSRWLELQAPSYPEERLIACYNMSLATQRQHRRQELLEATEAEFDKILAATLRQREPLRGQDQIALRLGKVMNRFKVAKHFQLEITDTSFTYERKNESIEAEAKLDGIYVVRTSVSAKALEATEVVKAYKSLIHVEQAFRCFKSVDLKVRPIFHRLEERVRAHLLLCLLAYYVEWHMRQALAPMLFEEDDPQDAQTKRTSIVESAKKSESAYRKASTKRTSEDLPVHSFRSLLTDLATIAKMTVQPRQKELPCFEKITQPTPVQSRAFHLLKVSL
jgi:transposase